MEESTDLGADDPELRIVEIQGRIEQLETVVREANQAIVSRLDRIEQRQVEADDAVQERLETLGEQLERTEERIWELEAEIEALRRDS